MPDRDVTVDYTLSGPERGPIDIAVGIEAGGIRLRVTSPALPMALVLDRAQGRGLVMLPMLKLYSTVGLGGFGLDGPAIKRLRFERQGQDRVAGHTCTRWTVTAPGGQGHACLTPDGVILAGDSTDHHGTTHSLIATALRYEPLPPALFQLPEGFHQGASLNLP